MTTGQTIVLDAGKALNFVNGILPILEQAIPAVGASAGPIGLGVSAASEIVLPLIGDIITELEQKGIVSVADQQTRLAAVQSALSDPTGAAWKPSTDSTPPQNAA